jgi:hypothetical protein
MKIWRAIAFFAFSLLYWWVALLVVGGILYASVCHYPDVPGCKTNLTIPTVTGIAFLIGYIALVRWFVRHLDRLTESEE